MNDTLVNWSLRALKVLAVTAAIIWSVILIWFGIYTLIFLTTMGAEGVIFGWMFG